MTQLEKVNIQIAKLKNLPPLPEVSMKIMTAVNNSDISVDELVDVISLSPVLTARLLGLANSSYFGRSTPVDNLRTAIIQVLGLNLVKSLALSLVLNVELDTSQCKLFDTSYFWSHSLITAIVAQKLAAHFDDELLTPNTVYTSGLLLNIGLIAAVYILPEEINKIFASTEHTEGSVSKAMVLSLGFSQYELGEILLNRWKLPGIYPKVLREFRKSEFTGKEQVLVKLLELSHLIGLYIVTDTHEDFPSILELHSELPLTDKSLKLVIDDIVANKDSIKDLALLVGA